MCALSAHSAEREGSAADSRASACRRLGRSSCGIVLSLIRGLPLRAASDVRSTAVALVDDADDVRHQPRRCERLELSFTEQSTGMVERGHDPKVAWVTRDRSEEHTSELQSLMRISYAVFCLKKKN